MSNKKTYSLLSLLVAAFLSLTLGGCALFGTDADQLEDRLRNTGINDIQLDFRPELLREKFENVEPDENGVFRVTFTESEVNDMLIIRDEDVPPEQAEDLQNLFIRFEEDEVLLDSELGSLFDDIFVARFTPTVENGALQLDLREASIGPVDVPIQFLSGLESAMNSMLNLLINNLPTPNTLQDIEVEEGSLTLVAQREQ